jgi:hypothetical protein
MSDGVSLITIGALYLPNTFFNKSVTRAAGLVRIFFSS